MVIMNITVYFVWSIFTCRGLNCRGLKCPIPSALPCLLHTSFMDAPFKFNVFVVSVEEGLREVTNSISGLGSVISEERVRNAASALGSFSRQQTLGGEMEDRMNKTH